VHLEEHHVDEGDQDGWSASLRGENIIIEPSGNKGSPLVEHQQGHVPEHTGKEHELRNELADDINTLLEVLAVDEGDEDPKEHVNNAEDDRNLHLEGVQKHDLVDGELPHWIYPEGIRSPIVSAHVCLIIPESWINHYNLLMQDILEGHGNLPGRSKHRVQNRIRLHGGFKHGVKLNQSIEKNSVKREDQSTE